MQNHVKKVIFKWLGMPQEVFLQLYHTIVHRNISLKEIPKSIFFKFGISFSAITTEKELQSNTSSKGSTKLSAMITGTHS
ncbi:LOW QUALITY PROTEIN: uncharacterized protein [Typha angustifolia]|uniref:LOW QUALITY PROTEIN: uncharacterized protein n=1 Tax=Typha angustifolia TaxID=59011 RepID=UPI003C2AE64A